MACVLDMLERLSRSHPGQRNVSDLKYEYIRFEFYFYVWPPTET